MTLVKESKEYFKGATTMGFCNKEKRQGSTLKTQRKSGNFWTKCMMGVSGWKND